MEYEIILICVCGKGGWFNCQIFLLPSRLSDSVYILVYFSSEILECGSGVQTLNRYLLGRHEFQLTYGVETGSHWTRNKIKCECSTAKATVTSARPNRKRGQMWRVFIPTPRQ